MPRTRNPYPTEFREQLVALARAGRSVESLAREYEPCAATIHDWVKQAGSVAVRVQQANPLFLSKFLTDHAQDQRGFSGSGVPWDIHVSNRRSDRQIAARIASGTNE